MRRSFVLFLTICLICLPVLPTPSLSVLQITTLNVNILQMQSMHTSPSRTSKSATSPGPDLAIANWTSNHLPNPGFEDWSDPDSPDRWSPDPSGDEYVWIATQPPDQVSEGTYSAGLHCRSLVPGYTAAYLAQYSLGADMQNLTISFDWYLDQNPNPSTHYFYLYIELVDGSTWYIMNYWLNGTPSWTNTSNYVRYNIGGPSQQWNSFQRNMTQDFLDYDQFPSSVSSTLECRHIYFYVYTVSASDQHLRAFVDDVYLENESYIWIGGATNNGNFESGSFSPWYDSMPRTLGYFGQSANAHSGSWSANLTALSDGKESSCEVYSQPDCRITDQNPGTLSFWWYLDHQHLTFNCYSYIQIEFYNGSDWRYLLYVLGSGGTSLPMSNSTWAMTYLVPGYNTTSSWMYCEQNIWDDASAYFNADELYCTYLSLNTRTLGAGARSVILFDDMQLKAGALNAAGFEDQRAVGRRIRGFGGAYQEYNELTVTDAAFRGNKALNLTVADGAIVNPYLDLDWRVLDSTQETYLDVMWRLEDYTSTPSDAAFITLTFIDGKIIRYNFASETLPSNTSSVAYFNITGANTLNTWIQMHRDLVHDYEAAFGSFPNTYISVLTVAGVSSAGNRLELLLDDLYLYDDPAPRLSNVFWDPITPNYDETEIIEVDAEDQDLDTVLLYYRTNGSPWQQITMAPLSGITYRATIPEQPHDTFVEFFFEANDTWGMTTVHTNLGNYWSYTVWDQSVPEVEVTSPSDGAIISETVDISAVANDWGSGIATVEFFVNDESLFVDTSSPYTFAWDTTTVANGVYDIRVTATDNVDLSHSVTISVTVNNVLPAPPIPGFPFEAIGLALITTISIGLLRRRKRN